MPAAASPESPFCPLLFTLTKPAAAAASDVADSTSIAIELEGAEANDMDGLDDSDDEEVANNTVATTAPQTLRWWTPHGEAKQGSLVGAVAADKGMLSPTPCTLAPLAHSHGDHHHQMEAQHDRTTLPPRRQVVTAAPRAPLLAS